MMEHLLCLLCVIKQLLLPVDGQRPSILPRGHPHIVWLPHTTAKVTLNILHMDRQYHIITPAVGQLTLVRLGSGSLSPSSMASSPSAQPVSHPSPEGGSSSAPLSSSSSPVIQSRGEYQRMKSSNRQPGLAACMEREIRETQQNYCLYVVCEVR